MAARTLLADVTPLRESPAFRQLWIGSTASAFGSAMSTFAVALQVYRLTGSSAAVGGIGLAAGVPAIAVAVAGGRLIDTHDRRRIVLITSWLLVLGSALFVTQAYAHADSLPLLYALVAVQAGLGAVNLPARRTFAPRLLPPAQVPAAAALTGLSFQASVVGGPMLAGVITAGGGLPLCYVVDAASFAVSLYGVWRLPPMRPPEATVRPTVREGVRFVRTRPVVRGALLADLVVPLLAFPIALYPAINAERFGGSPRTLGLLSAGLAVGGVVGAFLSGPASRVARPGRAMLFSGVVWGLAACGFGLAHGLLLTLAALFVAGLADVFAVLWRTTIVQLATPDGFRGRTSAAEHVVGVASPQIGAFRAGLVAAAFTPTVSAVAGGVACLCAVGLLAASSPALVRWRAES